MASDVGIRVGVDGAAEFKTAIRSMNGQMRTLDSEMRALTSGIDNLDDAEAAAAQRMDVMSRKIQLTGQRIQTLTEEYDRQAAKLEELGRAQEEAVRSGIKSEITRTTNAYNHQQQVVNDLTRQLNSAQADMNRFEREMRDIENGTDRLTQSFRDTGNAADDMGNSLVGAFTMGAVSGAVQSLISGVGGFVESTREMQVGLSRLEQNAQSAGISMDAASEAFKSFNVISGETDSSIEAVSNLLQTGFDENGLAQAVEALSGAVIEFPDTLNIESLADGLQETLATGTATGQFAELLDRVGVGAENFSDKLAQCTTDAEKQNLVLETLASAGLNDVYEAYQKNNSGLVSYEDAMTTMQMNIADLADTVMSLAVPFIQALSEAFEELAPEIESAVQSLIPFAEALAEKLEPVLSFLVDNWQAVIAGVAGFIAALQVGKIVSFVKEVGGLGQAIMSLAGGPIGLIATAVAAAVAAIVYLWNNCEGFREAITTIGEGIRTAVSAVVEFIKTVFSALVEFFSTIIENIKVGWSGLTEFFTTLFSNIALVIQTVWSGIVTFFTTIAEGVKAVWNGVTEFFTMIFTNAVTAVQTVWGGIVAFFTTIWTGIQTVFSTVVEFFSGIFSGAVTTIQSVWSGVTAFFSSIWAGIQSIFSVVASVLGGFFGSAVSAIQSAWSGVTAFFSSIWSGIQSIFSVVSSVLGGFFSSAVSTIQSAWSGITSFFSGIWEDIKGVFSGAFDAFMSIGGDIVDGIKSGISDAWGRLTGWIEEKFGQLVDAVLGKLGINSPSRVFAEIGEQVMEGFAVGVNKDTSADKAITKQIKSISDLALEMSEELSNALLKKESELNKTIADMDAEAAEKQAAEELATYKQNLKTKYEELGKAEKKEKAKIQAEIDKMQKDWNDKQLETQEKAAKEQLQAQLSALQEYKQEYESALQEIEQSQQSMADKLMSYGELFGTITDEETGASFIELGDLEEEINAIERYGNALEELKSRGIPEGLLDEVVNLNVDDAIAYTDQLLNMTDDQYEKYMKLWEQKQEAAEEVARKFYQDEMDAMTREFVDKIPGELSGLKDDMRTIGVNSIQGLINGIQSMSGMLSDAARQVISDALSAMRSEADIHSPSKKTENLIGKPLAQGIEVGFFDQLASIKNTMASAIMAPFNRVTTTDLYGATAGMVNGMAAATPTGGGIPIINVPVYLNKRQIAEAMYDPLKQVGKQRGY